MTEWYLSRCIVLYCIVFWLTSLSTDLLLYKISTVSPICQSLNSKININYSILSQKFISLCYLKGTPPSQIHFLTSFLKLLSLFFSLFASLCLKEGMAVAFILFGMEFQSLAAQKLKPLHDVFLHKGTVRFILVSLFGNNLAWIFSEEP